MQNDKINASEAAKNIAGATATSFTICVLCWTAFWLLPDWTGTGVIGIPKIVTAVWASLGTCLCMSAWGFACFSEAFAKKAGVPARCLAFSVVGFGIIAAWVFGSGWCPPEGFILFAIICAIALGAASIATIVGSKKSDAILNERLSDYKRS